MSKTVRSILIDPLAALPLAGCVVYEPVGNTTTRPASFDRSWNAALAAAQDIGPQDQHLNQRFTQAYNRRMDR
jgi:phosphoribosylcarboxyaminoimidazole (NCAIR) mutase